VGAARESKRSNEKLSKPSEIEKPHRHLTVRLGLRKKLDKKQNVFVSTLCFEQIKIS
jgi:hypothetical protein